MLQRLQAAKVVLLVCLAGVLAYAQGSTSRLDGIVSDPSGAVVVDAQVEVVNVETKLVVKVSTNERGQWVVPGMAAGTYRVSISHPGFKTKVIENVVINSGIPATANASLDVGAVTETVEVAGGADVLQTATAAVSSTVDTRQVADLPFASRNSVELLVSQPGTQTPGTPRTSTINGLPRGALNVTMDGMNTQDNLLKSGDSFFSYIYPSVDSIEEITLTTSAAGVDATGQGAAQIRFVTRSGSNGFHGGAFWQVRNTFFDANTYLNNNAGAPRDIIKLNQGGAHVGGPIKKDKAFFFVNYELYKLPQSQAFTRTELTDTARTGVFTYNAGTAANPVLRSVDLLALAAKGNANLPAGVRPFATTLDPVLQSTYAQIAQLSQAGQIASNINNNDYNRQTLTYQPTSDQNRWFVTTRFDYNVTQKHVLSLVYNYDKYQALPDFLNNVAQVYPGTGIVLGTNLINGQSSNRFAGTISLRSTLTSRMTNEFHAGLNSGTLLFRPDLGSSALFSTWHGYIPTFGFSLSGVTSTTNSSRRNAPVKEYGDTVSWVKGKHQFSFGGSFDQINVWQQTVANSVMPGITFGVASGDPINTGATALFNSANLPGSSSTDQSNAAAMYAALTGRVSSISKSLGLGENSHTYGPNSIIDRDRQREYGLFVSDTWRLAPSVTVNLGFRFEQQLSFINIDNLYTQVGLGGVYGLSGAGNLFKPGTLTGSIPQFTPLNGNGYDIPPVYAPSIGAAWQLPGHTGILGWVLGNRSGSSVLRGGYSIATIREGGGVVTSIWGSNQGLSIDASVSNANQPGDFGPAGSVLFRDPTFPVRSGLPSAPNYPIADTFGVGVNDFLPHLKMGYVQSWNFAFQRELGKASLLEIRYNGNHGVHEWRQYNINEDNIVENGFGAEAAIARNNLLIARSQQGQASTNNYGNQGLSGQGNIPILQTAIGNTTDTTTATNLNLGYYGTIANSIATNASRLAALTAKGYPINMFMANPTAAGGGAFLISNDGSSYFDAMNIEFRRRLTAGLQTQFTYTWAKSLGDGASNSTSVSSQPTTLRNLADDRAPTGYDIRDAIKFNAVYELPFGQGRRFLGNVNNTFAKKVLEGWELAGVARVQSGAPIFLTASTSNGGIGTFNQNFDGVTLYNMTAGQLQDMIGNYKTTGSNGKGVVSFLPQNVINNTLIAFGVNSGTLDKTAPYIGPALPGQLGWKGYFYQPWQRHFDLSVVKRTHITERAQLEIRCQMLNVFNLTNFLPNNVTLNSSTFGTTTTIYNDFSGQVDPGSRLVEFQVRVIF